MKYRSEIDGLRAVAVVPVILFHAGVDFFRGGFVGVDIFFVISGFLVTKIILLHREDGKFGVLDFYERRARRILPALFLVLSLCIPIALVFMTPWQLAGFMRSLAATTIFVSNIHFLETSGYFGPDAELSPLLHTWSLAIEEQYYFLLPLLLMTLGAFSTKKHLIAILTLAGMSLMLAEWGWRNHLDANFFFTFSRFWELLIGSVCAVLLLRRDAVHSEILAGVGLLMVVYSIFFFSEAMPFPSFFTLIPVIGAALIILFAAKGTVVARLLSWRPIVAIGLVSYSAYLWHQPLFAFARVRLLDPPDIGIMVCLAAATFVLAWLTWQFVEQPFRRSAGRLLPRRRDMLVFSVTGGVILFAVGFAGDASNGWNGRLERKLTPFYRKLLASSEDSSALRTGCDTEVCTIFSPALDQSTIAIFGDSHAGAILPAFELISEQAKVGIDVSVKGGCPPLLGVYVINGNYPVGVCNRLAQAQFDHVAKNGVKQVVLVGRWSLYASGNYEAQYYKYLLSTDTSAMMVTRKTSAENFSVALEQTITSYLDLGAQVFIVDQVPQQYVNPRRVIAQAAMNEWPRHEAESLFSRTAVPRDRFEALNARAKAVFDKIDHPSVGRISLDSFFENGPRYDWYRDGVSLYRDSDHLSPNGARILVEPITKALFQGL